MALSKNAKLGIAAAALGAVALWWYERPFGVQVSAAGTFNLARQKAGYVFTVAGTITGIAIASVPPSGSPVTTSSAGWNGNVSQTIGLPPAGATITITWTSAAGIPQISIYLVPPS